ncbi:protein [Scardovia inopinata]|uniref:Uncharacterized protein n=1 Tax=Scardovia inopinata F0304 TaxID=641146 RepID=W5IJN6_SCAIO|nr:hypothetical protein [Scardovia inopinata]EFG27093.1 hypothetical protein HMPREF9020_00728 [Scardovia inopinata F0304]BAR06705.1 conserved hypothetical protein [Scardovia inopinata JCM 12537]SUV52314.1 protein [Scardovia inopinata]
MANRRERRAAQKRRRQGKDKAQFQEEKRSAGVLDEQNLNTRSVHLQERAQGEWKPSSSVQRSDNGSDVPSANPAVEPVASTKSGRNKQKKKDKAAKQQARLEAARREEMRRRRSASRNAHPIHWWFTLLNWVLLVATAIAFVVMIWVPTTTTVIVIVTILFCLGVLNIFFLARPMRDNPNVDENGTAI